MYCSITYIYASNKLIPFHSILYTYREHISSEKITTHIKTLSSLKWSTFVQDQFKPVISGLKDELELLCMLLQRHKDSLSTNAKSHFLSRMNPKSTPNEKDVPTAFKQLLNTVKVSQDEFHSTVDPAFPRNSKKARGRMSQFSVCVKASVTNLVEKLRGMADYDPVFLTDESMGIDKYGEAIGDRCLTPTTRARYRESFRKELAAGVEKMCIHFFGKMYDGNNPDCIFIWKVPAVRGPQHDGRTASTIDKCREMAPKLMGYEAVRHFNTILKNIADVPAPVRDALRNYLFVGDPNPNESIAEEYVQFVVDMVAGEVRVHHMLCSLYSFVLTKFQFLNTLCSFITPQPIDASFLSDGRMNNSRGGKGIGSTMYDEFWNACREVLLPSSSVEERRGSDIIYASAAHSIPNLVKLATDILKQKVDSNVLDKLPPIPSVQWVRLQFLPNQEYSKVAAQWTGRLQAKRAVQTRTLRKEHMDQHFVNAMVRRCSIIYSSIFCVTNTLTLCSHSTSYIADKILLGVDGAVEEGIRWYRILWTGRQGKDSVWG